LFPLFATGVVDTGGAPCLANITANFRNDPHAIFRGLREDDSKSKKSCDTVPFKQLTKFFYMIATHFQQL
jgi:hypothetical protein